MSILSDVVEKIRDRLDDGMMRDTFVKKMKKNYPDLWYGMIREVYDERNSVEITQRERFRQSSVDGFEQLIKVIGCEGVYEYGKLYIHIRKNEHMHIIWLL